MNTGTLIVVLVGAGLAALIVYALWKKKKRTSPSASNADVIVYSDVVQTSPQGVRVASYRGVGAEFLDAVDAALNELFLDAVSLGYSNRVAHDQYLIYVKHDWELSPVDRVPSFRVRADNYDGTIYDVDPRSGIGYVYATEYVIRGLNGIPTGEYVITNDPDNLARNVRYGAEHIILYFNDPVRYAATETHTSGGHPLIPSAEEGLQ